MKKMIIGLTGASGSAYFLRLMEALLDRDLTIHVIASPMGIEVMRYETGIVLADKISEWKQARATVLPEDHANLFSPVASGSYRPDAMVIVPCSMATLGEIAHGLSSNLLTRAADVILKEKQPLIVVPRETPLSAIQIKNMGQLADAGAVVMPAMPAFYGQPQTVQDMVDFMAGRILDTLGFENNLYQRWEGN